MAGSPQAHVKTGLVPDREASPNVASTALVCLPLVLALAESYSSTQSPHKTLYHNSPNSRAEIQQSAMVKVNKPLLLQGFLFNPSHPSAHVADIAPGHSWGGGPRPGGAGMLPLLPPRQSSLTRAQGEENKGRNGFFLPQHLPSIPEVFARAAVPSPNPPGADSSHCHKVLPYKDGFLNDEVLYQLSFLT